MKSCNAKGMKTMLHGDDKTQKICEWFRAQKNSDRIFLKPLFD